MRLIIKCSKCDGPMWEERLPDSRKYLDLVCLYCGKRSFVNYQKHEERKRKLYNIHARRTLSRRALLK